MNAKEWRSTRERNLFEGHQGVRDRWMSGSQVSMVISKKDGFESYFMADWKALLVCDLIVQTMGDKPSELGAAK